MAAKEAVAGGVVLAGGAGGGYAAYHYLSPSEEDEEGLAAPEGSPQGKTIEKQLEEDSTDKEFGKPISKVSANDQNTWWDKVYHKFLLEAEDSDKVGEINGKQDRDEGITDKKDKFKKACEDLFKLAKDGNDAKYETAKKWCVTFKTIKEKLTDKKELEGKTDSKWTNRFTSSTNASNGSSFKTMIEKLRDKSTETSEDSKKKDAIYQWCTMALNAEEDNIKQEVESYCFDSTNG